MIRLRFHLTISPDDYVAYYAGKVRSVLVSSDDGLRIEFPAEHLREFVTHEGIRGYFEIAFDEQYHFVALRKLSKNED
jgi:hypothetical protein